jgi:5-methylcytosine-specific restriction protein A
MANPDWTRDELILALDLYFREPSARGSKSHPGCAELSAILNSLPIHSGEAHENTFRNPNGVGMKLSNFLKYDPSYTGKGLQAGSKLEEEVWNTFASNQKRLSEVAGAIKAGVSALIAAKESVPDIVEADEETEEGKLLVALHKRRERDASFARKKKDQVLKSNGALACEVCQFDFNIAFGPHGYGFAECHHDRPLSKMAPGEKTKLSDLRIVCANCHRMLHRGKNWPTIIELQAMISSQKA